VTREASARLETSHGLTLSDFDVLVQLFHAEGHRLRRIDLARQVLLTASGITRLLDGLERAGWVAKERCSSDQRVTYAVLTKAGLEKISEARESHHRDIDELFGAKFSEEELARLDELLQRLPLADTACQA
jgi:DNA-binding MarR family transcriptional regulator